MVSDPQCPTLLLRQHHVAPASVDASLGCAVSYVAPELDGFSGLVTFSAPVENVAPALAVASTPALSGESCLDELRGATEGRVAEFFELVQHDEGTSSGN